MFTPLMTRRYPGRAVGALDALATLTKLPACSYTSTSSQHSQRRRHATEPLSLSPIFFSFESKHILTSDAVASP